MNIIIKIQFDANINPSINTLILDENLDHFFLITDIIDSAFEYLPILLIQYLNNSFNNGWRDKETNNI